MSTPVELIKGRLDIVEVIGEYLPLKRAGINFSARCPFHDEKTPSFYVSPTRQTFRCFGCGEGGDIFTFVQKREGLDFKEALQLLARRANVELPAFRPQEASKRSRTVAACEAAASFYASQLVAPVGQAALAYARQRGLSDEIISTFRIGYAPAGWESLLEHLNGLSFSAVEVEEAGLAIPSPHREEGRRSHYDRFRNRLIFPIRTVHGEVVAFGARALAPEDEPKYLNSPQTVAYSKSQLLYNLDVAKDHVRKLGYAILVEGYMDCVAAWEAGTKNVVAVSGTAITDEQLLLLKRFCNRLMVAFDADTAGDTASRRGVDAAWRHGFDVKAVVLPEWAKDPDECVRRDPEAWLKAVREAKPIVERYLERATAGVDLTDVAGKKAVAKAMLPVLAVLADPVEQAHYLQLLGRLLRVDEAVLRSALPSAKPAGARPAAAPAVTPTSPHRGAGVAERLLSLGWRYPKLLEQLSALTEAELPSPELRTLYRETFSYYASAETFDIGALFAAVSERYPELVATADRTLFQVEAEGGPTLAEAEAEATQHVRELRLEATAAELRGLERQMREAEAAGHSEALRELATRFSQLSVKLAELQRQP